MNENTKSFLKELGYNNIFDYYQSLGHNPNENNSFSDTVHFLKSGLDDNPKIFIFHGDGNNGKSDFIKYLKTVIGKNQFRSIKNGSDLELDEKPDDPLEMFKDSNKIFLIQDEFRFCLTLLPFLTENVVGQAFNKMMESQIKRGHKFIVVTNLDPNDDKPIQELIKNNLNKIQILKFTNRF